MKSNTSKTSDFEITYNDNKKDFSFAEKNFRVVDGINYHILDKKSGADYRLYVEKGMTDSERGMFIGIEKDEEFVSGVSFGMITNRYKKLSLHNGVDTLLMAYRELKNIDEKRVKGDICRTSSFKGDLKTSAKLIMAMMDKYIFNTPESRDLLAEYLQAPTPNELNEDKDKNNKMQSEIAEKLKEEKKRQTIENRKKEEQDAELVNQRLLNEIKSKKFLGI